MKFLSAVLLIACSLAVQAQQVLVRNVTPIDYNTIAYPNLLGNTQSSQAYKGTVTLTDGNEVRGKITFFRKKDETNLLRVKVNTGEEKKEIAAAQIKSIALDPQVFEKKYPNDFKNSEKNFQPGYIILPTGEKLQGKVAQFRDFSDYDFFVYNIGFLPEGSEVASIFRGGKLAELGQQIDGKLNIWDGYADGYLLRMVDGRFRLSRNPYSKTKNEFFTSVKNNVADSLAKDAAQRAFARSVKSGQDINTSIENAANTGQAVSEVLGSIEINKKEYLIFDTRTGNVLAVNKDNLPEHATTLSSACGAAISASWDAMEEFVRKLNASCK
ncbi:MAG: hypothetical protein U0U09_09620 [Cyclobacteriaceae bacterium]